MKIGPVSILFPMLILLLIPPLVPCILSGVNVKPTGVLKVFCDHPNLTWNHLTNISSRPLTGFTKCPEYAVTRSFVNSIQADMNFNHCLSPVCFRDQIVTSCMGLLIKGPWFTYAHTEIGGGASFALLNTGIKIWCASTSSTGTRFFERCCHSPEGFIELMQRGPRERESRYLQFTFQRPGDLIYIPHLLAQAVLTKFQKLGRLPRVLFRYTCVERSSIPPQPRKLNKPVVPR